ncbi:hypothetical protein [Nostoc sp. FACHB-145]|uniref:hypothetical protein n=1 Tax=Nostoc sp. FACHB-145 TaxID=2692836 RepID=UPI0016880408|nr:hypothetical protein [Nostoc sp. FACHB-145]MBD2473241.1 hypothetical protein [Nostoc sp. FACHB-145]
MQPTISIPKHWDYPSFTFGQRTQQGLIIGLELAGGQNGLECLSYKECSNLW